MNKKFLPLLLLMTVLFSNCKKHDYMYIYGSDNILVFEAIESSKTISIKSNCSFFSISSETWCIAQGSWETLELSVSENKNACQRTAVVELSPNSGAELFLTIVVIQNGMPETKDCDCNL